MTTTNATTVLLLPGWQNSGPKHWQTLWEQRHGYRRVEQHDWERPLRGDWMARLEEVLLESETPAVLVAHSLGCQLVAAWAGHSRHSARVAGALLVTGYGLSRLRGETLDRTLERAALTAQALEGHRAGGHLRLRQRLGVGAGGDEDAAHLRAVRQRGVVQRRVAVAVGHVGRRLRRTPPPGGAGVERRVVRVQGCELRGAPYPAPPAALPMPNPARKTARWAMPAGSRASTRPYRAQ